MTKDVLAPADGPREEMVKQKHIYDLSSICHVCQLGIIHIRGKQDVFLKHYNAPAATKSEKTVFSAKVTVKDTRSVTLASFERES